MDLGDSPITLVIKAPNQRLEDQTVECMLGWTVKKLKKHLENVYPSKPKETQQKLIYSGKLLPDDATLKDVLRQSQGCPTHHTVHLVCSAGVDFTQNVCDSKQSTASCRQTDPSFVSSSGTSMTPGTSNDGGLRYRGQADPVTGISQGSTNPTIPQQINAQMPQMMMPPGAEAFYTQEQYMVMMQNYYYQMAAAQYMQYYQTGVTPTPPNTPTMLQQETANQREDPIVQAQANVGNAGDGNGNNMVMNAQGGMMAEDDDDDFGQRDWLDYVHTFARFVVLISIVYFYSNFTRFLVVFAFFFLIYLYQTGWFQLARRGPENQQDANVPQDNTPVEPQEDQQQAQVNPETDPVPGVETPSEEEDPVTPQPELPPPRKSVISIVWCFISTFFTSLIPQPPPAVNAN